MGTKIIRFWFHEAGVSANNAVRPREDGKVGAVSECEDGGEKPDDGEEEGMKPQKMQRRRWRNTISLTCPTGVSAATA